MNILFDKINIALIITAFVNLILGLLIYFKGKRRKVNIVYTWIIIAIISWILAMIVYRIASAESSVFWCAVLYISATFIASSFLYFTYIFPFHIKKIPFFKKALIFLGNIAIVVFILIPNFIIVDVIISPGTEKSIIFGSGYIIYVIYTAFYFSYGFWRLFKKYIQTQGIERSQIIYLLLGCVLAANLAFITNLFMPWFNRTELNWLGQIFTLFMVGFAAYAIVVHRLMDIKFVLRRSSVYLISLSTVLILATPIEYIFNRYFIDITAWADLAILILALSIFPPIKRYYYRSANKYFFASLYDSGEVIAKLSDKLRSTLELNRICEFISSALMNAFHTEALGILIYNEKTKSYTVSRNTGFNISRIKKTIKEEQLYKLCAQQNEPIIVEELKRSSYQQYKQIIDLLTDLKIETVTPLNIKDKTIGIVIAGIKESGDMYNDEDLKVLKVISAQAAIAIENALLYKETKNFAIKLKKEVKKATAELRVANKKLKKLDAAKSEFISIASHQLRTPLTIIKGYISMMLEGAFGQLSEQELSPLEKVYESNERLIQLVENLLNISRIESGRLQFNFTIMRLEDIVGSVIEEMANSAKKKGLRLDYKKPGKPLPGIKIDEEKIRQVIINLIDNAIKYTKQGGITVSLSSAPSAVAALGADNAIQFCASDTGMGVSQEDLPNLFKKFSRGKGVSTVHTEGTGLGLYVSKMMIEAHQGKIWCESEGKGRGSRFCFKLGAG